jgi:chromosome segregation ATPase
MTDQPPATSPRSAALRDTIAERAARLGEVAIHPDSPLGRLQAQLEAARAACTAAREELDQKQAEAAQLDAWLAAADSDTTDPAEFAIAWAKRELLGRTIAKRQQRLAELEEHRVALEGEAGPLQDAYLEHTRELAMLQDRSHEQTRVLPLYLIEQRVRELETWLKEMTGPPAKAAGRVGA